MSSGLDPTRLTPIASLNRVRFVETPGLALPADLLGRTAFELLSARALADLVRQHGDSPADVSRRFGERLGWLVVTLRRGAPASRVARPDWDDTYWRHWAGIATMFLGGGIVGGELGPRLVEDVARTLEAAGLVDCAIHLAPWPAHLPLIGAARTAPTSRPSVALDFGQSFVKRAVARYEHGSLVALRILPPHQARWADISPGTEQTTEQIAWLGDFMVATIVETWRAASAVERDVSSTVFASLASYLRDGQPLARQGGAYAGLLALSDNLAAWLAERVSHALGRPITVSLLHDGTAAAHALAGEPRAAVITLGTALGVGFPPAAEAFRPLAPAFALQDATAD